MREIFEALLHEAKGDGFRAMILLNTSDGCGEPLEVAIMDLDDLGVLFQDGITGDLVAFTWPHVISIAILKEWDKED